MIELTNKEVLDALKGNSYEIRIEYIRNDGLIFVTLFKDGVQFTQEIRHINDYRHMSDKIFINAFLDILSTEWDEKEENYDTN